MPTQCCRNSLKNVFWQKVFKMLKISVLSSDRHVIWLKGLSCYTFACHKISQNHLLARNINELKNAILSSVRSVMPVGTFVPPSCLSKTSRAMFSRPRFWKTQTLNILVPGTWQAEPITKVPQVFYSGRPKGFRARAHGSWNSVLPEATWAARQKPKKYSPRAHVGAHGPHMGPLPNGVGLAKDRDVARVFSNQSEDASNRGGLSGPVWPEKAIDITRLDLNAEFVDRNARTKSAGQAFGDECGSRRLHKTSYIEDAVRICEVVPSVESSPAKSPRPAPVGMARNVRLARRLANKNAVAASPCAG